MTICTVLENKEIALILGSLCVIIAIAAFYMTFLEKKG